MILRNRAKQASHVFTYAKGHQLNSSHDEVGAAKQKNYLNTHASVKQSRQGQKAENLGIESQLAHVVDLRQQGRPLVRAVR